jgi:hypothetical protein
MRLPIFVALGVVTLACAGGASAAGAGMAGRYAVFSGRATFRSTSTTGQTVAVWTTKGSWHLVWDAPDTNANRASGIVMSYSQKVTTTYRDLSGTHKVTTGCSDTVRLTKGEVGSQFLSITQLGSGKPPREARITVTRPTAYLDSAGRGKCKTKGPALADPLSGQLHAVVKITRPDGKPTGHVPLDDKSSGNRKGTAADYSWKAVVSGDLSFG